MRPGGKEQTEMLSQVLSGLTLVRHAVAITLVMGVATATVAGAVDMSQSNAVRTVAPISTSTMTGTTQTNTTDLEAAVNVCLETKDPASEACTSAVALSGLSSETFWAKIALSLKAQLVATKSEKSETPKAEPTHAAKPESTIRTSGELVGLVTACLASHERSSE